MLCVAALLLCARPASGFLGTLTLGRAIPGWLSSSEPDPQVFPIIPVSSCKRHLVAMIPCRWCGCWLAAGGWRVVLVVIDGRCRSGLLHGLVLQGVTRSGVWVWFSWFSWALGSVVCWVVCLLCEVGEGVCVCVCVVRACVYVCVSVCGARLGRRCSWPRPPVSPRHSVCRHPCRPMPSDTVP